MTRHAVLFLTLALLCGCSSSPVLYAARVTGHDVGYSEFRLEAGRYRVTFQGAAGAAPGQVADYALLRAAELAAQDGYDWFRVAQRSSVSDGHGPGAPAPGISARRIFSGGLGISTTLEVVFGRGTVPATGDAYSALKVIRTLGHGRGRV